MSDGEHTTPEMDFAVLLLSNHQQPPLFQVLDPVLEVSMGGQVPIGERRKQEKQITEVVFVAGDVQDWTKSSVCVCVCASSVIWLVCVGGQQLAVSDADTAPDELEFELVEAPVHGELLRADVSAHTSMINGEMITPAFQTQIQLQKKLFPAEKPQLRLPKQRSASGGSKASAARLMEILPK